jgi:hypothetical protein
VSTLLQFQQQRPRGHVFEFARSSVPLPSLGQNPRQAIATPHRITLNQRLYLANLDATDMAALNGCGFEHPAKLSTEIG